MEVWAILRRMPSRCFWLAFVLITVINGGVQMVIYFPIIKSSSRKGSRLKTNPPPKRVWEQVSTMQHTFVHMGQNPF